MKNYTTRYFCMRFCACEDGTAWALNYADMRSCYDALLRGDAGEYSASWAIWVVTREGVMSDRNLRLFAVRCARRVQHLMRDRRSVDALDVAERYAVGQVTDEELYAAEDAARAAAMDAASAAAWYSARASSRAAEAAAEAARAAARDATWDAERAEQLKLLAEFGNPFERDGDVKV